MASINTGGVTLPGLTAEEHWDPDNTNIHKGEFGDGHRGDLSKLTVNADGRTTTEVRAALLRTNH